jgi:glycyl-tRNA synthetase beta chain
MELVFEIFSEEIPARMQSNARKSLAELAAHEFKALEIEFKNLESFVTPRRLALVVQGLDFSKTQIENFIYKKGQSCNGAANELEDFKTSLQSQRFEIIKKSIQGEDYFFAKITKQIEAPEELMKKILERMLHSFTWPKSMRWDSSSVKWIRPIRNLLSVLDGNVLPIKYGEVIANNSSFGHKFLSPEKFFVQSAQDYFSNLKQGKVILNLEERKSEIKNQIAKLLGGLNVIEDEDLLEEVAGLVEYPTALLGEIDKKFLTLPREVIISALRTHQKYFVVEDARGKLSHNFVVVSNIKTKDNDEEILKGNQKVLRARLEDAQFFFNEDRETSLESKLQALKKIIFHEKIGTVFEKTLYTENLVQKISELAQNKFNLALTKRAALLAKSDLTTNLVNEFPELQGIIGKYYAELDGEDQIVSNAIADHYLPKGKEENFPASIEGGVLSIADKIITLTSLFAAGEAPTSSKDPFALRRQAVGIIKLLCHFKISLNITSLIDYSLTLLTVSTRELTKTITDFLYNRFKFFLKDHFKVSLIEAVLSASSGDFYSDYNKLICLTKFIDSNEGNKTLLSIKRIINILAVSKETPSTINESLFNEHEKNLYEALLKANSEIKLLLSNANHEATLKLFANLAIPIEIFFEKILVMYDNKDIRTNRLALLKEIEKLFLSFANFLSIDL